MPCQTPHPQMHPARARHARRGRSRRDLAQPGIQGGCTIRRHAGGDPQGSAGGAVHPPAPAPQGAERSAQPPQLTAAPPPRCCGRGRPGGLNAVAGRTRSVQQSCPTKPAATPGGIPNQPAAGRRRLPRGARGPYHGPPSAVADRRGRGCAERQGACSAQAAEPGRKAGPSAGHSRCHARSTQGAAARNRRPRPPAPEPHGPGPSAAARGGPVRRDVLAQPPPCRPAGRAACHQPEPPPRPPGCGRLSGQEGVVQAPVGVGRQAQREARLPQGAPPAVAAVPEPAQGVRG